MENLMIILLYVLWVSVLLATGGYLLRLAYIANGEIMALSIIGTLLIVGGMHMAHRNPRMRTTIRDRDGRPHGSHLNLLPGTR